MNEVFRPATDYRCLLVFESNLHRLCAHLKYLTREIERSLKPRDVRQGQEKFGQHAADAPTANVLDCLDSAQNGKRMLLQDAALGFSKTLPGPLGQDDTRTCGAIHKEYVAGKIGDLVGGDVEPRLVSSLECVEHTAQIGARFQEAAREHGECGANRHHDIGVVNLAALLVVGLK